jgi:ethanolamine utilization microcompartment shell protein EutL
MGWPKHQKKVQQSYSMQTYGFEVLAACASLGKAPLSVTVAAKSKSAEKPNCNYHPPNPKKNYSTTTPA